MSNLTVDPPIFRLPNELLLKIFTFAHDPDLPPGCISYQYHYRTAMRQWIAPTILSLSSTCKRFAPWAQEILVSFPTVGTIAKDEREANDGVFYQTSHVAKLARTLLHRPELRPKIEKLRIGLQGCRSQILIQGVDPHTYYRFNGFGAPRKRFHRRDVMKKAEDLVNSLDLDARLRTEWIDLLDDGQEYQYCALLLALMPNLRHLEIYTWMRDTEEIVTSMFPFFEKNMSLLSKVPGLAHIESLVLGNSAFIPTGIQFLPKLRKLELPPCPIVGIIGSLQNISEVRLRCFGRVTSYGIEGDDIDLGSIIDFLGRFTDADVTPSLNKIALFVYSNKRRPGQFIYDWWDCEELVEKLDNLVKRHRPGVRVAVEHLGQATEES
ncbi:hypothetical protein BDV96DRAFT_682574 [Lophiotrema nucula]|uniref:Uncharacterized protein n=1 Tax=Lophiotrema nucula TaxID=690887 RepID=A0A6A5ZSU2_9PLEO|nr:hypothetical protein BDV96DRAFT_682574 [Lophiotrema nucula]